MRLKHTILFILFIGIAFVGGLYLGLGKFEKATQTANALSWWRKTSEEKEEVDFDEFLKVWDIIETRHPNGNSISSQEKMWGGNFWACRFFG